MASRPKAEIELTARNRVNEAVDAANRSLSGLGRTAQFVTRTLGALGALQIGKRFLETADQAQTLENRLRLVTHSSHQLAVVQNELFRIAQETNSSFAGTIELYSRMARATADVGISQERLLNVTRTINQAMLVSGASAEEAERALVQLSQGLAAGALRGQDLNSVISQTPRLAQAIAEGMGMAFGQLKTAAEQGQLSTEAVIRALEDQAETIRREYGQMEATVGQSVTNVGNSMVRLVGKIDEAIGASDRLRFLLDLVSRGIDKLGDVVEPEDPLSAKIKEQIALIERLEQGLENLRRRPGTPEAAIAEQERRIANLKADLQVLQEAQRWMEEAQRREAEEAERQAQERAAEVRLAAQREAAEKELEEIVKASKTREELEAESLRKRLEQLREFLSLRIIDEQRYYELSHELAMRAFEKGVGKPEEDKEEERRREQLERDLEQIREFVMTREEVELEAHRQRLERLRELLEAGRIQEEEFYELSIKTAERTQERITEIQRREDGKRKALARDVMASQIAATLQGFAQLAQIGEAGSRKMFLISRALAVASAIVSTKKAVAEALATPPVPNVGLAKVTAALGAAQIAGILATSFGGGGGGGGGSGALAGGLGSASMPQPPTPPPIHQPQLERGVGTQTVINVTIQGGVIGLDSDEVTEKIADNLRRVVEEKDVVIISPTSRNAADLRG